MSNDAPRSMAQIRQAHVSHQQRCAELKRRSAYYEALKQHFPHIRHDATFMDALTDELAYRRPDTAGQTTADAARKLRDELEAYRQIPSRTPEDLHALMGLYVDYVGMERDANANYRRPASLCQWRQNPDCFADNVTARRAARLSGARGA